MRKTIGGRSRRPRLVHDDGGIGLLREPAAKKTVTICANANVRSA